MLLLPLCVLPKVYNIPRTYNPNIATQWAKEIDHMVNVSIGRLFHIQDNPASESSLSSVWPILSIAMGQYRANAD